MNKVYRNKRGLTLVEIVVAISLLGVVLSMVFGLLFMPGKVQGKMDDEADVQAKVRLLNQNITKIIRDSSATFALPRSNHDLLTAGWNYIIPSFDISKTESSSIIEYIWNEDTKTHVERVIAQPQAGVTYQLKITKKSMSSEDNLLMYEIITNVNGDARSVQSEVEALNSLQVVDRGNTSNISNTIAYRTDPRPTQISEYRAAVTMVLDLSGSMRDDMAGKPLSGSGRGYDPNNDPRSRIYKLRQEAERLVNNLAENANIYVSIVPFNNHANDPKELLPARQNNTANPGLLSSVRGLWAEYNRGTNTGDGMRRAYYILDEFNKTDNEHIKTNNFMIILVDGATTYYSAYWRGSSSSPIVYFDGNNNITGSMPSRKPSTPLGYYAGRGNSTTAAETGYVDFIGAKIRNYGTGATAGNEPIKVYVIGFSADANDKTLLKDIALATTGDPHHYDADDAPELEEIFAGIGKDISDSLWHIGGPN